jgi:hypothetical protein
MLNDCMIILFIIMLLFMRKEWARNCLINNPDEILYCEESWEILIANRVQ